MSAFDLIGIISHDENPIKINVNEKANQNLKKWIYKKKNDSPDIHKYSFSRYGVSKSVVEKKFQFYDHKKYINN